MTEALKRRDVLTACVAAAAAGSFPLRALAQSANRAPSVAKLTDRLSVLSGIGANVTVLSGDDGALLVDGGSPQRDDELLAAVAEIAGSPDVPVLFNTNWRPEHSGVNERLGGGGTRIVAHENTKLWMGADFDVPWESRDHAPRPRQALPNDTFYTTGSMEFAAEPIEYGYLGQAHTDGDIYVFFPRSNVLVVSDVLAVEGYPVVDYVTGGWIGGMEEATKALLDIADADTRIVAAAGPVQTRAALEAQLTLCTRVREAVRDAYRSGHSVDEFIAARPVREFEAERGDPELFLHLVYQGAWGHVRELGGGII